MFLRPLKIRHLCWMLKKSPKWTLISLPVISFALLRTKLFTVLLKLQLLSYLLFSVTAVLLINFQTCWPELWSHFHLLLMNLYTEIRLIIYDNHRMKHFPYFSKHLNRNLFSTLKVYFTFIKFLNLNLVSNI